MACLPLLGTQANGLIFWGTLLLNLSLLCSMAEVCSPSFWLCRQTGLVAFHDLSHKLQPQSPSSPCKYQLSFALSPKKQSGDAGGCRADAALYRSSDTALPCQGQSVWPFPRAGSTLGGRRGSEQGEGRGEQIVSRGMLLSARRQLLHPGSCLPSRRCLAAGSTRSPQYCHP